MYRMRLQITLSQADFHTVSNVEHVARLELFIDLLFLLSVRCSLVSLTPPLPLSPRLKCYRLRWSVVGFMTQSVYREHASHISIVAVVSAAAAVNTRAALSYCSTCINYTVVRFISIHVLFSRFEHNERTLKDPWRSLQYLNNNFCTTRRNLLIGCCYRFSAILIILWTDWYD